MGMKRESLYTFFGADGINNMADGEILYIFMHIKQSTSI
jgi:hypothetical protein